MPEQLIPDSAVKAIQDSVHTEAIDGYYTRPVFLPPPEPQPEPLVIHTLSGLADFVLHDIQLDLPEPQIDVIHIVNHNVVEVLARRNGIFQRRPVYARAVVTGNPTFHFGRYYDQEELIISLQTAFVQTAQIKEILSLVGTIHNEHELTANDDGVSQRIITRKGMKLGERSVVPNPVSLAPYRTFGELDQPESFFVLRLRGEEGEMPKVALFEIGDNHWQLRAIELIKAFLAERITEITVIA